MFGEQLIDEFSNRSFFRVRFKFFVFPNVTERPLAAEGFMKLGSNDD
jgi:hypothetical protein